MISCDGKWILVAALILTAFLDGIQPPGGGQGVMCIDVPLDQTCYYPPEIQRRVVLTPRIGDTSFDQLPPAQCWGSFRDDSEHSKLFQGAVRDYSCEGSRTRPQSLTVVSLDVLHLAPDMTAVRGLFIVGRRMNKIPHGKAFWKKD